MQVIEVTDQRQTQQQVEAGPVLVAGGIERPAAHHAVERESIVFERSKTLRGRGDQLSDGVPGLRGYAPMVEPDQAIPPKP